MQTILLIDDDIMEFRLIKNMLQDCFDTPFALKYADNKSILDVYDIVDKYHIRNRIRDGLLSHSVCA